MKRVVRILRHAQSDLAETQRYAARDRPAAAQRLVERLLRSIESLEETSDRGVVPRDGRLAALGYRVLVEADHLVFYKVSPRQIRVYRVLHGRRKYAHLV